MRTAPEYNFSTALTIDDLQKRVCRKIAKDYESGCSIWTGAPSLKGYGRITIDRRALKAHRLIASLVYGKVPAGMVVDHLCRNRLCVNPKHLEIVTNQVNVQRGLLNSGRPPRSSCNAGHAYSEDTVCYRSNGLYLTRRCRVCILHRQRERRAKIKDLVLKRVM